MPPGEQHRPQTEFHRRFQHTLREKFPGKICHHHHHHHCCWSGHNGPHAPLQQTDTNCQTRKPTFWCLCVAVCSVMLQHKWLFYWYLNAQSTTKLLWVGRGGLIHSTQHWSLCLCEENWSASKTKWTREAGKNSSQCSPASCPTPCLKGNQASDARYGLETPKMCKPFHLLASFWWSHQYLYKRCTVFLPFWAPQGHHHGGLTFTNKSPMNAEWSPRDTVARFLVLLWISLIWTLPGTKWQHSQSCF